MIHYGTQYGNIIDRTVKMTLLHMPSLKEKRSPDLFKGLKNRNKQEEREVQKK